MPVTSVKLLNPIDPAKAQTLVRLATLGERLRGIRDRHYGKSAVMLSSWEILNTGTLDASD
jgi:hypothetical protein